MKLAIDFDSTICKKDGTPVNGVKNAILFLSSKGHELYICTSREEKDWPMITEWLKMNDIPQLRITNKKELETVAYIDDRSIRFTNWEDIRKYFG